MVSFTLMCVAAATPAWADEQDPADLAKELAKRAVDVAGKGDLPEALKLFKAAARLDPQPEYFCNAGNAYDQLGKTAQAHLWLSQCLDGRMGARNPEAAKAYRNMYEKLEKSLRTTHAPIELTSSPSGATVEISAFADDDEFTTPKLVWLPVGNHAVTVSMSGYEPKTVDLAIADRKSQALDVRLEATPVATGDPNSDTKPDPSAQPDTGNDRVDPTHPIADPSEPRDTPRAGRGKTPLILLGVGGIALVTGGVFHFQASGTRGDLQGLPEGTERNDLLSTFSTQRGIAIAGYAIGAVAGGIGLYMMLRSPKRAKSVALSPAPSGDGAMVWLSWSR